MKIIGTFYLNSGIIIEEMADVNDMKPEITNKLTQDEIEVMIKNDIEKIKETYLTPAFKDKANGMIEFGNTIFKLSDISAVKFVIEK